MMISSVAELKNEIMMLRPLSPKPLIGASEEDIEAVRVAQKVKYFPAVYREFLSVLGRGAGYFYMGDSYVINALLVLKDELLKEMNKDQAHPQLPDDAFVFWGHHGYKFMYFLTGDKNDNPPLYLYVNTMGDPIKAFNTLIEHWDIEIEGIWEVEIQMVGNYRGKGADWFTKGYRHAE